MTEQHLPREATTRAPTHASLAIPERARQAKRNQGSTNEPRTPPQNARADDGHEKDTEAEAAQARRFAHLVTQAARTFQVGLATIERALPTTEGAWIYDPAAQHAVLERLRTQLAHLREQTDALHALAPLQMEAAPSWVEAVEVGDLLMGILPRWKTRAPQTLLELALPGEVPTVLAESALVERALDALLTYMVADAPSGDTIRVSVRPRPESVLVSLRHHGRPLSDEALATLFEPDAVPQVGLALALARAIVEAHGGHVWAEAPETGGGVALYAEWPMLPSGRGLASETSREGKLPPPATSATVARPASGSQLAVRLPRARHLALVAHVDARMARYLRANLEEDQCAAMVAASQAEALRVIEREEPDIVLIDGNLCGADLEGLVAVCAATSAPVLVLPRRADPGLCARMLDLGARDVLGSPFAMEELLARTRAALRERAARAEEESGPHYTLGELEINIGERRVARGGKPIALSKTEFKLLRVLAQHGGMVLGHDVLLERVWGSAYSREVGFLWVYVRRLRRKIEPDPAHPRYILTVPGIGYQLARAADFSANAPGKPGATPANA